MIDAVASEPSTMRECCWTMCSLEEFQEREQEEEFSRFETTASKEGRTFAFAKAIKCYRRAAAGRDEHSCWEKI